MSLHNTRTGIRQVRTYIHIVPGYRKMPTALKKFTGNNTQIHEKLTEKVYPKRDRKSRLRDNGCQTNTGISPKVGFNNQKAIKDRPIIVSSFPTLNGFFLPQPLLERFCPVSEELRCFPAYVIFLHVMILFTICRTSPFTEGTRTPCVIKKALSFRK